MSQQSSFFTLMFLNNERPCFPLAALGSMDLALSTPSWGSGTTCPWGRGKVPMLNNTMTCNCMGLACVTSNQISLCKQVTWPRLGGLGIRLEHLPQVRWSGYGGGPTSRPSQVWAFCSFRMSLRALSNVQHMLTLSEVSLNEGVNMQSTCTSLLAPWWKHLSL